MSRVERPPVPPPVTGAPGVDDRARPAERAGSQDEAPARAPGEGPVPGRARPVRWWPLLVPLVVVLVGAWHYRWVDEDAFIDFRVIANLLAGHGLVFNVGERVEVDSDPLWLFTLVAAHGVLPFVRLEWLSVGIGLLCTAGGFLTGGRAVQRLMAPRERSATVLPVGLLLVSVVAGVWEFATSGLEMSMVFLWLGASYLLLVHATDRVEGAEGAERRGVAVAAAVVIGLGSLVRPELALMAVVFLAALLWAAVGPAWRGGAARAALVRRAAALVAAAVALPLLVELFRMGYYALLAPNTGLAKAGGSAWWAQGLTYLWNFVSPYTLWLPLAMAAPLVALPLRRWWRSGDHAGAVLLVTPVVAGLVDALYVVRLGGDYMHARLLLPAFFAVCLPVAVPLRRAARATVALPLAVIAVWSVVCGGWLRFVQPPVTSLDPQTVFISNERDSWTRATHDPHPVTADDYAAALSGRAGSTFARLADRLAPGHQQMLVITDPFAPIAAAVRVPARSPLPFRLAVDVPAVGVIGYLSGSRVYLFDSYSLANPVGSHTEIVRHARPGHEKYIGPAWMVGRFGLGPAGQSGSTGRSGSGGSPPAGAVAAARRALGCAPLSSYLSAITAPLSPSRFVDDLGRSFGFTRFSFSADPEIAAAQLCGPAAGRSAVPDRRSGG